MYPLHTHMDVHKDVCVYMYIHIYVCACVYIYICIGSRRPEKEGRMSRDYYRDGDRCRGPFPHSLLSTSQKRLEKSAVPS